MFSGSVVSPWDSSAHIRTVSRFVGVEKKAPFFTRMNTFLCRCSMFNEQQVSSSHGHISSRLRSDLSPGHRIAVRRLWTTWLKARSVYKSYKWILPALVSVQTHWVFFFPLHFASFWEVTGSNPTAALYHCNSVSEVKCERSDWTAAVLLQAWFHLMWLMVFYYKMLQRLGVHGSIFQKYNSITWNVTFSGVFIHYSCVTVITASTWNRLHRLKSLFALQKYSFKLLVDTFKNGFYCLDNVFWGSLLVNWNILYSVGESNCEWLLSV